MPEYRVWASAKARCHNRDDAKFYCYGGRGIRMCDEWREDFAAFIRDMGARPSRAHQLDRIDNDGPYSPANCRWATRAQQARNRRTNRWLTHNGETLTIRDWGRRIGLSDPSIRERLDNGLSVADALTPGRHQWKSHRRAASSLRKSPSV